MIFYPWTSQEETKFVLQMRWKGTNNPWRDTVLDTPLTLESGPPKAVYLTKVREVMEYRFIERKSKIEERVIV